MKKILVAYFSHSGNTKVVANSIKEKLYKEKKRMSIVEQKIKNRRFKEERA